MKDVNHSSNEVHINAPWIYFQSYISFIFFVTLLNFAYTYLFFHTSFSLHQGTNTNQSHQFESEFTFFTVIMDTTIWWEGIICDLSETNSHATQITKGLSVLFVAKQWLFTFCIITICGFLVISVGFNLLKQPIIFISKTNLFDSRY